MLEEKTRRGEALRGGERVDTMLATICSITIALIAITLFDLVPKWKGPSKKLFWIAAGFTLTGYVVLLLSALSVHVPSPMEPVVWFAQSMIDLVKG